MGKTTGTPAGQAVHAFCGGYCTVISSQAQLEKQRIRQDYAVLLTLGGNATYWANGVEMPLAKGVLVLVRPRDERRLLPPVSHDFQMMRMQVPNAVFTQAVAFLGKGFEGALDVPQGSIRCLTLGEAAFTATLHALSALKRFPKADAEAYLTQMRLTVMQVLWHFFGQAQQAKRDDLPPWLADLAREMRKKHHYIRGLPAMYEITGYTPEHLCRAFRRHLQTSPTRFLNAIRIEEAALRLVYTADDVAQIAAETGYDNLSHFYHQFKQRYGVAPLKYRRQAHAHCSQG